MSEKPYRDILDSAAADSLSRGSDLWPRLSAQLERKSLMSTLRTRPLLAILLTILALLLLSGAAYALGRSLGYIPGIGLVDNSSGIRMLAEPVTATRDGVSLTISSVFVYPDRVELAYEVSGIATEDNGYLAVDAGAAPTAFCGGTTIGSAPNTDGDARLQLPDGTVLERDRTGKYPQNAFAAKPVYAAIVPARVTRMTLVLDCLPMARRGSVPESWSVPFELRAVPAGTVVGAAVIDVNATSVSAATEPVVTAPAAAEPGSVEPAPTEGAMGTAGTVSAPPRPVVNMALTQIVPLDSATVVYLTMDMQDKDPSLVSIMPLTVYAIDSQGQRISMRGNYVWQPFEHRAGSEFEFVTGSKPAAGPLTIVVEKAVAYYAPLHVDPPQASPADLDFSFDAGQDPQPGETWALDRTITVAGYPIKITSARATTYDEYAAQHPGLPDAEGYQYGYDFTLETDPSVKMLAELAILNESPVCWLSNSNSVEPESSSIDYLELCRDAFPKGKVTVQLWQLAVLLENDWQATWQP
jgi:hypothetical protein